MYRCNRCDEFVEDDRRAAHSATEAHQSNGGNAEVVDDDYELLPPGTRGSSKTR